MTSQPSDSVELEILPEKGEDSDCHEKRGAVGHGAASEGVIITYLEVSFTS